MWLYSHKRIQRQKNYPYKLGVKSIPKNQTCINVTARGHIVCAAEVGGLMWYASFGLVPSPLDTFRCLFVHWGCAWYSRGLSLSFLGLAGGSPACSCS